MSVPLSRRVDYRRQALQNLDRLPPFSPILNRLLASLAQEDVCFAELAAFIEKDTVLAGSVLRLVNSPLYGLRGTVTSVRHAVAILGLVKLRNVVLGLSVSRLWAGIKAPPGWSSAAFNQHSVATALLADLLVEVAAVPHAEGAFVAGLLHDIGKLLVAISLPREYVLLSRLLAGGDRSALECERELLGTDHAELSASVLERWNLPAPIQSAVRFHHHPELADQGQLHLAHVVHTADLLAADLGYSAPTAAENRPSAALAVETLGAATALPRLLERFQNEFDLVKEFFR